MRQHERPKPTPAQELACLREWKIIGIALATAAGAVEAKVLAEHPELWSEKE